MAMRTFWIVSSTLALLFTTPAASHGSPPLAEQLEVAAGRGEWVSAAELARRMLKEKPGDIELLTRLARCQRNADDLERATDTLRTVISLAGEPTAEVLEIRGDIAKDENRPEDALSDYQLALREASDSERILEKIALHYVGIGKPDNAAIYYEKLAKLRKQRGDHVHLARAAVRRRDWNAMVGHLSVASELASGSRRRPNDVLRFEALLSKAVQLGRYDRAIKGNPKNLRAILDRAELFHACGFYEEALEDARRASRLDGRAPHVRLALAYYYVANGERKKGAELNVNIRALQRGNGRLPIDQVANYDRRIHGQPGDIGLLHDRAALLLDHDQAPLALEDIERALEGNPDSVVTLLLKVRALEQIHRPAEVRALVRKLAEAHPDNEDILHRIGRIQMEDGLYEEAIVTFDKILAKRPTYEKARDSRTLCFRRLQRHPKRPLSYSDTDSNSQPNR